MVRQLPDRIEKDCRISVPGTMFAKADPRPVAAEGATHRRRYRQRCERVSPNIVQVSTANCLVLCGHATHDAGS